MRIPDLAPYTFGPPVFDGELAVGWLDDGPIDPTGTIEPARVGRLVVDRLTFAAGHLPSSPVALMGVHRCHWCDGPTTPLRDDGRALWGSGEIRVRGGDGTVYVAPNLVAHYIEAHRYRPPPVFIEAVLEGDFIEQPVDLPDDHVLVGLDDAPGELRAALGPALRVARLERRPWNDEAPRPMLGLHLDGAVHGPWDGTVDHARRLLAGGPLTVRRPG